MPPACVSLMRVQVSVCSLKNDEPFPPLDSPALDAVVDVIASGLGTDVGFDVDFNEDSLLFSRVPNDWRPASDPEPDEAGSLILRKTEVAPDTMSNYGMTQVSCTGRVLYVLRCCGQMTQEKFDPDGDEQAAFIDCPEPLRFLASSASQWRAAQRVVRLPIVVQRVKVCAFH